ncbi:response regulator transcription factor [Saliterribacillus persicus]|uniref:AraC family two component transcriptional regulator n=1 Tax=Saliterribacillus persicus TaxID=930114 RepID=A0A368XZ25_9BACI|nr:response regulator transcription factor [Saliterribacillus persicus]RCW73222.1 AraC family two component transcriptional regulator [Saliterribacillus persicus]
MKDFYKILIVDDEMLIRQGIINYIEWENEGYKIIGEASNGEEAMELIHEHHPHILITDIVMPGMDGIELVKQVKEVNPDTEIIVLSSFENFDYVRQTFQNGVADYILKPKLNPEELLQTLKRITQKQQKSTNTVDNTATIKNALVKAVQGYQSIREMDLLRQHFSYNTFVLLEVFWKENTPATPSIQTITDSMNMDIENTHAEIPLHDTSIVLLVNLPESDLSTLKNIVKELSNKTQQTPSKVKWILSKAFSSIEELKQTFEEDHLKLQQYHYYLPNKPYLLYDELPQPETSTFDFDLNHMIYLFKRKQFQDAFIYVNKNIGILSNQHDTEVFEFKSWLENIMFNIIVLLGNMGYEMEELESEKYTLFSDINDAFDVGEAIAIIDAFLEKVETMLLPFNKETTTKIQLLLDYIEEHYDNHLSLQTLADHFHFNPSYLSSYFSKHHQEGFSEYVNRVRIKNAMQMLESSDMSISAISEAVGYSDASYFTKVFRKVTAKSPRTYRKENQKMN